MLRLIEAYQSYRWLHRLVNWLVGVWRVLTPGVRRQTCPFLGHCSDAGLTELKAHGIRAVPAILGRMHRCKPPRAVIREAAINTAWLAIRKPRSQRELRVQLRLARWALSWLDWGRLQAEEWVIQLGDLEDAER